jgi:uncharacterized protein (DUF2235 family)
MKRIAIFCDGTWNSPDEEDKGISCSTNVVKMALSLSEKSIDNSEQILFYDAGIGTDGRKLEHLFDGATGTGISRNILEAYEFVIKNYEKGDQLYFFGFSRGAFTVRSLAGLIRNCGILKKEFVYKMPMAYEIYKSNSPLLHPKKKEATLFRKTFAIEDISPIEFIGVFDTVGALGNPISNKNISNRNQFHDTELSSHIKNAYHALSIDEKRKKFEACLWHLQENSINQHLEQMWFAGVHSDVGGGYPETQLSDISLKWMMEKAESCNLHFNAIIDPVPSPFPQGTIHESFKWYYLCKYYRPLHKPDSMLGITNEEIHTSAIERIQNLKSYRPNNLVDYCVRNHIPIP